MHPVIVLLGTKYVVSEKKIPQMLYKAIVHVVIQLDLSLFIIIIVDLDHITTMYINMTY